MIGSTRNTIAAAIAGFLGAVSLAQISSDGRLLPVFALAIIILEGLAWSGRLLTSRSWPGAVSQLAALIAMIWIGSATSLGGSTADPWRALGQVSKQFSQNLSIHTVPVPADNATLIVLLAAIGLLTIIMDLIFIGAHNASLAALPMLAFYMIALLFTDQSLSILSAVAIFTGWLVLLSSRTIDHEMRWPRSLSSKDSAAFNIRGFSGLALVLAIISISMAILAGLAIPPQSERSLPGPHGPGQDSLDLRDPLIDLNENLHLPEDRPLFSYTTGSSDGIKLRNTALTVADSSGWHLQQMSLEPDRPDRKAIAGQNRKLVDVHFSIGDYTSEYLPLPFAPVKWDAEGSWSHDPETLTVLNVDRERTGRTLAHTSYSAYGLVAQPSDADLLADSSLPGQTSLAPADLPAEISALAHEISDQAIGSGAKALALQNWLADRDRFVYDLSVPSGIDYQSITNFLVKERRGYCVHFASSMALMAQAVGIPARVAVGFSSGTAQADGSRLVTSHNMHAWPELYIDTFGWVGFEPTASSDTDAEGEEHNSTLPPPSTSSESSHSSSAESDQGVALPTPTPDSSSPAPAESALSHIDLRIPLILLACVLLASPALVRALVRRRRLAADSPDKANAAWRELQATALDLGSPWPLKTPRQIAANGAGLSAQGREALHKIAIAVERHRFAAQSCSDIELSDDVRCVIKQWYESAGKRARIRAKVLPRSLFTHRKNWF